MTRKQVREGIAKFLTEHPDMSYAEAAAKLQCAPSTVAAIAREYGVVRQRAALSGDDLARLEDGHVD